MTEQTVIERVTASMLATTQSTVEGLTEAIVSQEASGPSADGLPHLPAAKAAMVAKVQQMPVHLQLGMTGLTIGFSAYVRARTRKSLHELPLPRRLSLLNEWRNAPIGPCRQFVQFYEKMGIFLYYSLVEESIMPPMEVR